MNRQSWALLAVAVSIIGLGVVFTVGSESTTTLVVADSEGNDQLEVSTEPGAEVALEYTHSVERTPVTDIYVVTDQGLVSDRMLFSSFGAGLPAQADVTREGNRYVYEPPAKRYDPLIVTTGTIAGHELVVDGERFDLTEIADGGTVQIRVESGLKDKYGI